MGGMGTDRAGRGPGPPVVRLWAILRRWLWPLHRILVAQQLRAQHQHFRGGIHAKLYTVAFHPQHIDGDVAAEDNRLAGLPAQYQHGLLFLMLPGGMLHTCSPDSLNSLMIPTRDERNVIQGHDPTSCLHESPAQLADSQPIWL